MKSIYSFLAVIMAFSIASPVMAAPIDTVKVWGNCEMCKSHIEKAAKEAGAKTAQWDVDTHILSVSYAANKTSLKAIEQKVAGVGHDTQNFTAPDKVYKSLHGCCQYERKSASDNVKADCCASGKCTPGSCQKSAGIQAEDCCANGKCEKHAAKETAQANCCADGSACNSHKS